MALRRGCAVTPLTSTMSGRTTRFPSERFGHRLEPGQHAHGPAVRAARGPAGSPYRRHPRRTGPWHSSPPASRSVTSVSRPRSWISPSGERGAVNSGPTFRRRHPWLFRANVALSEKTFGQGGLQFAHHTVERRLRRVDRREQGHVGIRKGDAAAAEVIHGGNAEVRRHLPSGGWARPGRWCNRPSSQACATAGGGDAIARGLGIGRAGVRNARRPRPFRKRKVKGVRTGRGARDVEAHRCSIRPCGRQFALIPPLLVLRGRDRRDG